MKVLIIHSYYRNRGGEDSVFEQESELLSKECTVQTVKFKNRSGFWGFIQFVISIWNPFAGNKLKKAINKFEPDIIHIHNLHFGVGPIAIRIAKNRCIPIILTLHNYRILCPSGTLLSNGQLFTSSLQSVFPWQAIREKVYRNSYIQTFWLTFVTYMHRVLGTWKLVDKFIVLNSVMKDLFKDSQLGINQERFIVKPNFTKYALAAKTNQGDYFLFVGRLSIEKGILTALEAFSNSTYRLKIAGDGPLKNSVLKATKCSENIEYLGSLNKAQIQERMTECTALIFPSIWYETFGLVIIESFASGTPVIASDIGSPSKLITHGYNGLHFAYGDAQDLLDKITLWSKLSKEDKEQYRKNCLADFEKLYTSEKNIKHLMTIYSEVLEGAKTDVQY